MRYEKTIEYLEGLYRLPLVPSAHAGLERARFLMAQLGNPHHAFRSVHVAGSTGKGSTTAMLSRMLQAAGFRTGAFRSPHLCEYTERIAVDGADIPRDAWIRHFETLRPIAERMREGTFPGYELGRPALFELLFALAALYFREAGVEWAVLETGLGGRLDATNLVQSEVAVVTNISLEHTQVLGRTIPEIAREKAAIIKPGAWAVTGAEGDALPVVEARAGTTGTPLLVVGRDVTVESARDRDGLVVTLAGHGACIDGRLQSAAPYQAKNAAIAFATALALRERGVEVPDAAVRTGLRDFCAPGRFELLPGEPPVLLDGAHNPAGMRALAEALGVRKLPLLFAAMDDKDVESMADAIAPHVRNAVVTLVPHTDRSATLERVARAFRRVGIEVYSEPDPAAALTLALERAGPEVLLVSGSLYLVGFAREHVLPVPA